MKILVTGRGTSASWLIRGAQLGEAIGADIEPQAENVSGYDLAICVKRIPHDLLHRLHKAEVPIVWDVVDAWPQPEGNSWRFNDCAAWICGKVSIIKPVAIVAATKQMASDIRGLGIEVPVLALPHHARPRLAVNPIRERVAVVGYEGGVHYLGRWRKVLEEHCRARGWRFVVNPPQLAELDIVVAFRDFEGYAAKHWKSNVKLANAQGSGTPCVMQSEAGYLETASGFEFIANTEAELSKALDWLAAPEIRKSASVKLLEAAPRLETIAKEYTTWLSLLR